MFWPKLMQLIDPSHHNPEYLKPHLEHAGVLVPLCASLPCECTSLDMKFLKILTIVHTLLLCAGALGDDGAVPLCSC